VNQRHIALAVASLAALFLFAGCASQQPVSLLEGGSSRHVIVLAPDASPSERYAAQEWQSHFKLCSGVELPIRDAAPEDGSPMIVLGCGEIARKLGVDPPRAELAEQGYAIRTVPPHLVIAGTREGGTLCGVHRALEDYLGVRWPAPGVIKTPKATNIVVPPVNRVVRPAFLWRFNDYSWPGADPAFLSRMGQNTGGGGPDHQFGRQHAFDGICHSYFNYISPGEFFASHPEYFAEIGGKRTDKLTQLCLTNPDVLEIVTQRMLDRMKNMPGVRQHNFSQMDYYNYCQCAKCQEVNARLGTSGGTQYWFLNQLAERTSKVYPDKLIGTLAYMYTEEPPKGMMMHPNIAVWLCHMFPSCDSHPIATCPHNGDYKRRAIEWSKICGHLCVWHYITNFTHYYVPFPNLRAMAADMKFYRDIGVEGIFLEGMRSPGGGGEFSLLRPYYGMKLVWDPGQDADAIIRGFLQDYYGAAWEPIWDYIVLLHDKVEKEDIHMHLFTGPGQGYLTDDVMARASELFDRAEQAVKDDLDLLERVRVCRMPLVYASMFPRNGYRFEKDRLIWPGDFATPAGVSEFNARMRKHGFQDLREYFGDPKYSALLNGIFRSRLKVVTLTNDHLRLDAVPLLAGRVVRIIHRKTGKDIASNNRTQDLFFPFCGGLETRIGDHALFYGWIEPAIATRQTTRSVMMTMMLFNGLRMDREISLDEHEPLIRIRSTVINPGGKHVLVRIRQRMELDLGRLRETGIDYTDSSGKKVTQNMAGVIDTMREGMFIRYENVPDGSWTFAGTKGLRLRQTFDAGGTEFAWLCTYPEYLNELEVELWAKERVLGPGEQMSVEQTLCVE